MKKQQAEIFLNNFKQNFDSHKEILTEERYGISNLMGHLQKYLANSIRKMIPEIKTNLKDILKIQRLMEGLDV